MPQKRRGNTAQCILRWLPAVVLPFMVGMLQPHGGLEGLPMMLFAFVIGLAISTFVLNARLALALSMLLGCFVLSAAHLLELQEVEESTTIEQLQQLQPQGSKVGGLSPPELSAGVAAPARKLPDIVVPKVTKKPEKVSLETLSIVLPCAMEGNFAEQTVNSIYQNTNRSRLKEVVIVDDGSQPPLKTILPPSWFKNLRGDPKAKNVVLVRHEVTKGLIGAKYDGGNAAKGDVIVFLDCHVKPRKGWEEALLRQMKRAGDHRTVAVPTITSLNVDNWEEVGGDSGAKACYLMLNGDFTWLNAPGRDVPMMSGGLLGISRRWWEETGGLDDQMVAWGGENIDQSLRAWLCGGRIEVAEGSFVAHMWRDANNPKTRLKYPIPTEHVMRNKARAIVAWMGEFAEHTLQFPEYEFFVNNRKNIGKMGNFDRLKHTQKCLPFSYYIQRFHYVYIDGGLIPSEIFQLREESSGMCLERIQRRTAPHGVTLAACNDPANGGITELQYWHGGNRNRQQSGGPCCSGIHSYNLVQCLNSWGPGQKVETFECDISGHNPAQWMRYDASRQQILFKDGEGCFVPHKQGAQDAQITPCEMKVEPASGPNDGVDGAPKRFRLRHPGRNVCFTDSGGGALQFQSCNTVDEGQIFTALRHPSGSGLEIRTHADKCFDAADGGQMLSYNCDSNENWNQMWQIRDDQLVWPDRAKYGERGGCLETGDANVYFKPVKGGMQSHPTFSTCTDKRGQRFQTIDKRNDGTFLLKDHHTGDCLNADAPGSGTLGLGGCGENQRWRDLRKRDQVQHVRSGWCLDAGDEVKPITYPCHEPRAMRKQKFEVVSHPGWVRMKGGWEDNGRVRFFERCLDWNPSVQDEMYVETCSVAESRGIRFSKINAKEPHIWTLWKNSEKPPPGEKPLGGSAEPP